MIDFIARILRFLALAVVALIGLGMALIFTISTIIALTILFFVARLRGRRFSVQEYWTNRQAKRKPIFTKGNSPVNRPSRENVTDVEARDIR